MECKPKVNEPFSNFKDFTGCSEISYTGGQRRSLVVDDKIRVEYGMVRVTGGTSRRSYGPRTRTEYLMCK